MSTIRTAVSVALLATMAFGAGCSKAADTTQPEPQAQENTQPSMEGMMHDNGDGTMDHTGDMPMGDASGTMPMGSPSGTKPGMKQSPPPELDADQQAELDAAAADRKPGEVTFHVKGGSFFYVPNMIKVKKGDKVKIVFENVGGMHNINIDEFNVKSETVQSDKETTVEFTADKSGSFEYYCSVGQHRAMGQKGMLVVE